MPQSFWGGVAFIAQKYGSLFLSGAASTLLLAVVGTAAGFLIGLLIAIVRTIPVRNTDSFFKRAGLKVLRGIFIAYIELFRSTPMMVQLLIFSWVIFASVPMDKLNLVGTLAFGVNSGAYVAEIVRAGIQAVNPGQMEAGRSLGLTKNMTMRLIIMPQAIKNILPALANEAITLLKETAILGYIAVGDITYMATWIRSRTYSPVPLLVTALVYLGIVMLMTYGMRKLERRLKRSER